MFTYFIQRKSGRWNRGSQFSRAFSLIELLMSLGIFSFVMVGLTGLLIFSMKYQGQETSDFDSIHISNRLLMEKMLSNTNGVSKVETWTTDSQGKEVPTSKAFYRVHYKIGALEGALTGTVKDRYQVHHLSLFRYGGKEGTEAPLSELVRVSEVP